jgi:hypothetical protein
MKRIMPLLARFLQDFCAENPEHDIDYDVKVAHVPLGRQPDQLSADEIRSLFNEEP